MGNATKYTTMPAQCASAHRRAIYTVKCTLCSPKLGIYRIYFIQLYTTRGQTGGPGNPNFWINEIKCVFNKHKIKAGVTCSWRRLGTSKTISAVPEAMF